MIIDSTFWVAISFLIFIGLLVYFKIPQKIKSYLDESINNIQNQISDAENLKVEAENILSEHQKKINNSKLEIKAMIDKANKEIDKNILKTNTDFHEVMESRKKSAENRIKVPTPPSLKYFSRRILSIKFVSAYRKGATRAKINQVIECVFYTSNLTLCFFRKRVG